MGVRYTYVQHVYGLCMPDKFLWPAGQKIVGITLEGQKPTVFSRLIAIPCRILTANFLQLLATTARYHTSTTLRIACVTVGDYVHGQNIESHHPL